MSFVGFLKKYAGEAVAVAEGIAAAASNLPVIGPEAKIAQQAIDTLKGAAQSINDGIADGTITEPTVIISQADIDAAVTRYFVANPPKADDGK